MSKSPANKGDLEIMS